MGARRTEKISAVLTPELAERLSDYAVLHRWSLSTAVAELIEEGLRAYEQSSARADHSARYHQRALYELRSRELKELPATKVLYSHGQIEDDR
jgi:hypothetical protein